MDKDKKLDKDLAFEDKNCKKKKIEDADVSELLKGIRTMLKKDK